MKTFGKVMLTLLYMLVAGCKMYCVKQWLKAADEIWEVKND